MRRNFLLVVLLLIGLWFSGILSTISGFFADGGNPVNTIASGIQGATSKFPSFLGGGDSGGTNVWAGTPTDNYGASTKGALNKAQGEAGQALPGANIQVPMPKFVTDMGKLQSGWTAVLSSDKPASAKLKKLTMHYVGLFVRFAVALAAVVALLTMFRRGPKQELSPD